MKQKLAKLVDVKSLVTLALTAVFLRACVARHGFGGAVRHDIHHGDRLLFRHAAHKIAERGGRR